MAEIMNIFDHLDYVAYLQAYVKSLGDRSHGAKKSFAIATNCQAAFISRVFSRKADFSLEQAHALSHHLQHSPSEKEYFLLLVQFNRAGTTALKEYLQNKIIDIRKNRLNITDVFGGRSEQMEIENSSKYFSTWIYPAVHVLLTIPGFGSPQQISKHLNVPLDSISECIDFLIQSRIVVLENGSYKAGPCKIHVGIDSPHVFRNLQNWRLKAINDLADPQTLEKNLFFSSVMTVSEKDYIRIKKALVDTLSSIDQTVLESKEESLCVLNCDFFKL